MSAVDTEVTYGLPTDPEDANPPNTFTEPATEDPIFVANQTFEGLAAIPEDPTTKTLAVYFTDIVPIPFDQLEGTNDSFTPTDSNGTYVPPLISYSTISSTNFPFEGGVTTIITGVALDQVSHVRIQNYNCTYIVNSPTQLTITIPVCPDNDNTTSKTLDAYDVYNALAFSIPITYNPQVQVYGITSIDVTSGSLLGNTVVTITGGAFFFISRVIFDGTDVFQFEVINSTTILCTTSFKKDAFTGVPGSVQVIDYTGAIVTLPNAFTYVYPTPFILGLSSNNGTTDGGQTIVIAGAYFLNVTNVTVGGNTVVYNVDSDTQITFTTNAGTYTGISLDLIITTLYGSVTYSSAFTYNSPPGINYPTITSVSLNAGNVVGGTTFDIFGTNLDNVTGVTIGTTPVTSFTLVNPTRLTCVSGAGVYTGNALDIILNSPFGNVTRVNAWTYTYDPPTITSVNVSTTSVVGGDTVILTGTNFYLVSNVIICGLQAASYVVDSPTQITLITPIAYNAADTLGNIQVVATFGTATLFNSFTFFGVQTPIVSNITPTSGSTAGGTVLTVNGTNFLTTTGVTIDGNAASFVIDSNIQLTVTTPAASAFTGLPVNIIITNTFGSYTATNSFTYTQPTPIISSVTPTTRNVSGGSSIVLSGNFFLGTTSVLIDNVAATSYVVNSTTQITAVIPSSIYTNLPVNINVITPAGTGTLTNGFTYLPSPTISSVSPNTCLLAGGVTVVITGVAFTNASSVTLNGVPMTSYTIDSSTQITAVVPTGSAVNTPYDIVIQTPQGNYTSTGGFTYLNAPTISSVSPNTGATAGGNSVVIVGTNFSNASVVKIGTTNVTSYTVDSITQITAVTPSGSTGSAQTITVETPQGNVTSGSGLFTYLNAPTISNVTPNTGATAGGNTITIVGTNFNNATVVKVGTTNVTSYTVDSATQITAVTPSGSTGSAQTITVETPQGNVTSGSGLFSYLNAPTISSVSPNTGATAGGNTITIVGTNFNNATAVKIGTTSVVSYTVTSSTQITAVTPSGSIGSAQTITIETPQGNVTSGSGLFTYLNAPTISSVSPNTGATVGGNSVVITGTNFNNATVVKIGSTNVTSYTVDSATQITAVTPSGSVGSAQTITVETPQGNVTSGSGLFSYLNAPTISSVTPNTGATVGGNSVVITGTNFNNATAVKIGSSNVTSYTVDSATQITAVTPSGSTGSAQTITVETPQGNVTSGSGLFTYLNAPTISSISPVSGNVAGGDSVVITGTNFTNTSAVKIGSTNVTSYTVNSATQITAVTPAGSTGSAQTITVETPQGNVTSGTGLFTYYNTPTISGVSPTSGTPSGGDTIIITGTNFTNATAVKIDTTAVTSYTVDSNTQITAVTPAGTGSNLTITVETPQGNVTSGGLFTYASGPTITSVSPNTGATAGGNSVVIVGTNFTSVTAVKIGTTAVASYTVDSTTQITAVTSAGTANSNETITVETSLGNGTSATALFTFLNTPTFTSISPTSGNIAGGTSVTIVGTNFTNATAVKIGTTNVTSYTVNSATQITATTAVGSSAGTAQTVTVETPQGNVTSGSAVFTYRNTPTVTSVSPTSGTTAGGTSVTITGTDFQNVSAVKIGTTAVTSFTVVSDTSITATTAAGTAGSAQTITVETSHGNGTSATGLYTYTTPPAITLVSPTSGFTTGGTVLTIIGTGFSVGDTVTVGGTSATSVTVVSSTKITCNTPSGTTGAAKDVVLNGSVTASGAFTYLTPAFNKSRYRSFTAQTVPAGTATYFHDVTYSSTLSLFAAVAQFSTGTDGIITSPNGTTWTRRVSPFSEGNNSYLRIVANATRFLTSGNNADQNATSTNGTSWTNITGITGVHSLAYSDTLSTWVVPQGNRIWYSTNDTSTWSSTVVTVNPLACIWADAPFNKFFLFPRQNGNILYSSNGSTWTTITPGLNTSLFYYAAAYSSDLSKIITIANSGQVYETTNGTTWSLIGNCVLVGDKRSLIWNSNLQCWFLSGSTGVAISANGIRWSRIATYSTDTNPDFTSKGIAYSPSLDVFVTAQASMYKSDGALKGSILFGNNNYLTCVNSVDFQFGTGDFTIEWYQYQTSFTGTQRVFSYGTQIAAQITSAGALEVILNNVTVYTQSLTNYYESQWRHIAIARQGTSLRVFYDGTQLGTTVTNSTNVGNAATVFCIGNASTPVSGSSFIGKITNFHVMKGFALYTANFSKPTEDIIAETTNAYTKLLLPAPSTNFILDYSATPKVVSNTGCTADSSSPYF